VTAANITLTFAPILEDPLAVWLFEIDLAVLQAIEDGHTDLVFRQQQAEMGGTGLVSPQIGESATMAKSLGMSEDSWAESLLRLAAAGMLFIEMVEAGQ